MADGAAAVAAVAASVSALTDVIDAIQEASQRKLIVELTNYTGTDILFRPQ